MFGFFKPLKMDLVLGNFFIGDPFLKFVFCNCDTTDFQTNRLTILPTRMFNALCCPFLKFTSLAPLVAIFVIFWRSSAFVLLDRLLSTALHYQDRILYHLIEILPILTFHNDNQTFETGFHNFRFQFTFFVSNIFFMFPIY